MANLNALFFLGILIGAAAGFGLIWWMAGRNQSPEPFFARLLRVEIHSAHLGRRLMLHELQRRVEELSDQVRKINLEILDLQKKAAGEAESYLFKKDSSAALWGEDAVPGSSAGETGPKPGSGHFKGLDCCREIYRLFQEGFSPGDIAGKLRMGRGEVELVLSLDKKPSWVVEKKIKSYK